MTLLESFLRSRGNLKEMERALGISYPTVRARVEALVQALGLGDGEPIEIVDDEDATEGDEVATSARREILEKLAKGDIDSAAAAAGLRAIEER
jgi:hypothetical protein